MREDLYNPTINFFIFNKFQVGQVQVEFLMQIHGGVKFRT